MKILTRRPVFNSHHSPFCQGGKFLMLSTWRADPIMESAVAENHSTSWSKSCQWKMGLFKSCVKINSQIITNGLSVLALFKIFNMPGYALSPRIFNSTHHNWFCEYWRNANGTWAVICNRDQQVASQTESCLLREPKICGIM